MIGVVHHWLSGWGATGDSEFSPGSGNAEDGQFRFVFSAANWPHVSGDGVADVLATVPGPWTIASYHTVVGGQYLVAVGPPSFLQRVAEVGQVPPAELAALLALVGG